MTMNKTKPLPKRVKCLGLRVLKPTAEIAKILGSKGVNESKNIVIYDSGTGKYSGRL